MIRLPQILFIAAFTLGLAPSAIAQVVGGALLLKNDRILEGKVELRGDYYQVTIASDSRVSPHVDQVLYVGADKEALYQFKVQSIKRWSVGDHFQLTRWCLLNDLLDHATEHYQQVSREAAGHPRVNQLAMEVRKKLLELPEFRSFLGMAEAPTTTENIPAPQAEKPQAEKAAVVTANTSSSLAETAMHPEIAAQFSQKVQPILMNRCSQAACHGSLGKSQLRLLEPYAQAFARISSENLSSVLKQVSTGTDEVAPLLHYATTPHGIQREAAISVTETPLLTELAKWIHFVRNPVVQAVASTAAGNSAIQQARNGQFVPFAPAVALYPVEHGASGLRQVPQAGGSPDSRQLDLDGFPIGEQPLPSEIDDLERQLRRILGEPEVVNPTPAGAPSSPQDPFDPGEFNRQSRTAVR